MCARLSQTVIVDNPALNKSSRACGGNACISVGTCCHFHHCYRYPSYYHHCRQCRHDICIAGGAFVIVSFIVVVIVVLVAVAVAVVVLVVGVAIAGAGAGGGGGVAGNVDDAAAVYVGCRCSCCFF